MKNFKPLALSAAVATATAGYAGVVNAQDISAGNVGDLAIVPYYTVQDSWITGVHIINTTEATQVVKLRFRRGNDSMDALDFNLIMSPRDEWVGYISGEDENSIVVSTGDSTCTAPMVDDGKFPMPVVGADTDIAFNEGAMEGYIEIIGMAQTVDESQPIAVAAKHKVTGTLDNAQAPVDCDAVESNFFRNATMNLDESITRDSNAKGILYSDESNQAASALVTNCSKAGTVCTNDYEETAAGALSVSYFIRNQDSGIEMGGRATHIDDYGSEAMMSNQSRIINRKYDPWGYFYPDLDGGSPEDTSRGLYDDVVRPALGVESLINDWAVGTAERGIDTDWVITIPGQYLMLEFSEYLDFLSGDATKCDWNDCDWRDIPVVATIDILDREEDSTVIEEPEDGLVISPSTGSQGPDPQTKLKWEVNVITWSNGSEDTADVPGAFNSAYRQNFGLNSPTAENGWAELAVAAAEPILQSVCDVDPQDKIDETGQANADCTEVSSFAVPMIGFTGWRRVLPDQPEAEYGRLIDHSFILSSSAG